MLVFGRLSVENSTFMLIGCVFVGEVFISCKVKWHQKHTEKRTQCTKHTPFRSSNAFGKYANAHERCLAKKRQ